LTDVASALREADRELAAQLTHFEAEVRRSRAGDRGSRCHPCADGHGDVFGKVLVDALLV